jgi:hypothetical protein
LTGERQSVYFKLLHCTNAAVWAPSSPHAVDKPKLLI